MTVFVPLPGSQRELLPNSRPAGPIDRTEPASITVRVRAQGDFGDLEKWVLEQADKPLADREYLNRADLVSRHGAAKADLDLVEEFARNHDLSTAHRSAAQRTIVLQGALGDLLSAFKSDLRLYHHVTGTYRGRQGEIGVPEQLAGVVTGVFGFDTRPRSRTSRRVQHISDGGPGGANGVPATEFASRYNFPTSFNGSTLDGTGQTIAIIELGGGYRTSDLKTYFREIGRTLPKVTAVSVDHAGHRATTADSADGEVMLDIEVAGAVAPHAHIVVYFAPNNGDKGFVDAINAAVHDAERTPDVISISWGGPENSTDQQGIDAFHEIFTEAAALGITICAASGDHGAALVDAQDWDRQVHVDHPASDNLVLGCGGTQITGAAEVVWNDNTPFDPSVPGGGGWATGGGISTMFPVPNYQQTVNLPNSIQTGKPGRGVPDIAMSATNYYVRVDRSEGASGGTSAVAPLAAAMIALLNQGKGKNVGFINPFLYANHNKGIVNDITDGTNAIKDTAPGYDAKKGWDACTGLGTPDGTRILNSL